MNFKCPKCNRIVFRDMRETFNKKNMKKRGFKSRCDSSGGIVYLKPVLTSKVKNV